MSPFRPRAVGPRWGRHPAPPREPPRAEPDGSLQLPGQLADGLHQWRSPGRGGVPGHGLRRYAVGHPRVRVHRVRLDRRGGSRPQRAVRAYRAGFLWHRLLDGGLRTDGPPRDPRGPTHDVGNAEPHEVLPCCGGSRGRAAAPTPTPSVATAEVGVWVPGRRAQATRPPSSSSAGISVQRGAGEMVASHVGLPSKHGSRDQAAGASAPRPPP